MEKMAAGDERLRFDVHDVLVNRTIAGDFVSEFQGRPAAPYQEGDVITIAFSTGGTGYGDPIDRDPKLVLADLEKGTVSEWAAEHLYKVCWDRERRRVDVAATAERRTEELRSRLDRGKPFDEFSREWNDKTPPEDALGYYGTWPDARLTGPVLRP
jgi:acetophenone carboxylase